MAYRVSNTLTTTTGNTYANVEEWVAEHGNCGTLNPLVTSGTLTLLNDTSVRCVKVFASEADHTAMKEEKVSLGINPEYTYSDIVKETI
jgi:hypothetical protein